jgi:hypothetical protein
MRFPHTSSVFAHIRVDRIERKLDRYRSAAQNSKKCVCVQIGWSSTLYLGPIIKIESKKRILIFPYVQQRLNRRAINMECCMCHASSIIMRSMLFFHVSIISIGFCIVQVAQNVHTHRLGIIKEMHGKCLSAVGCIVCLYRALSHSLLLIYGLHLFAYLNNRVVAWEIDRKIIKLLIYFCVFAFGINFPSSHFVTFHSP